MDTYHRGFELGFSLAEMDIIQEVAWHVPMDRTKMAAWASRELGELNIPPTTAMEYETAIDSLLVKRLLTVLTEEDVAKGPPAYSTYENYFPSSPGLLDWTLEGNILAKSLFGEHRIYPGT